MWEDVPDIEKPKEVEEPTLGFLTKQYEPNLPWGIQFRRGKFCVMDKDGGLVAQCSKGIDAAMIAHSCNRYLSANQPSPEATDAVSAETISS